MSYTDNTMDRTATSESKEIPKPCSLNIYDSSQCVSYTSQRSSSIETFESSSPIDDSTSELLHESKVQCQVDSNISARVSEDSTLKSENVENDVETSTSDEQWLCNYESMPASMLHPNHRSSPVKEGQYKPIVEGEDRHASLSSTGEEATSTEEDQEKLVFLPGDLQTPIMGYEKMESRSRFTVYKIQVEKSTPNACSWFIFRRYSDFVHLNERLKLLFPGFHLALPPKRWFRDNFDINFLEDRMLGLQAFLDNIIGHKAICNSDPVRGFFCLDDPPGPHDTLEESRALCDTLEETMYSLRQELQEKDTEIALLKEELQLYKSKVDILNKNLRAETNIVPSKDDTAADTDSPSSTMQSIPECDHHSSLLAADSKPDN